MIPPSSSPFSQNFIMKNGELRSRPRMSLGIPGPQDNSPINNVNTFLDSNNVVHTTIVTQTGLWQLNRTWTTNKERKSTFQNVWSKVGTFGVQPGPNLPSATQVFVNSLYWTN